MVSPFAAITNKAIESQIIKQAVPDIYQEGDENRFGSFKGKRGLFDLNSSMRMVKTFVLTNAN